MILWLILGAMLFFAVMLLVWPLLRPAPEQMPRDAYDLEIYRDQLAELDRDKERGLIAEDQADAARAEIGRRVLTADQRLQDGLDQAPAPAARRMLPFAVGIAAPVLAIVLYLHGGTPRLAEMERPMTAAAKQGPHNIEPMIEKLIERLRQSPDDLEGWTMLARSQYSITRFDKAAAAYANALALDPGNAELMSRQAEALSFANDGLVTPNARQLFAKVTDIDPKNARARYYLALAQLQSGKRREAMESWRLLAADAATGASWLASLRKRIDQLAAELDGETMQSAPIAQAAPGPTAADVKASQSMTASDRSAMIRSMVQRLADRLEDEPDDRDGWLRLGRAYKVLGEQEKSRAALAKAAALQPKSP